MRLASPVGTHSTRALHLELVLVQLLLPLPLPTTCTTAARQSTPSTNNTSTNPL